MAAIILERLGKCFDLTPSRLIRESLSPDGVDDSDDEEEVAETDEDRHVPRRGQARWALKDISALIAPGERVAIVGANGAGKTTLLKIIAGLCLPTEGMARGRGRVVPVNSMMRPFHTTATGLANVRVMARVLRVDRSLLEKRLPAIVAFSGLGEQVEKPVRNYSSGMYGRLAMAAVLHLDPDILLVDEGVNVGDIGFRQSVEDRLAAVVENGATLLYAGHKLEQLEANCDRALWLDDGRLRQDGPVRKVLDRYVAQMLERHDVLSDSVAADRVAEADNEADELLLIEGASGAEHSRVEERHEKACVPRFVGPEGGRYGRLDSFEFGNSDRHERKEFAYLSPIACRIELSTFLPCATVDLQIGIFSYGSNQIITKGTLVCAFLPDEPFACPHAGRHCVATSLAVGLPPGEYTVQLRACFQDAKGAPQELALVVQRFQVSGDHDDHRLRRFQRSQRIKRRPILRPRSDWRLQSLIARAPKQMVYEA